MELTDLCDVVGYHNQKAGERAIKPYYAFAKGSESQDRVERAFARRDFSRFIWEVYSINSELGRRLLSARDIHSVMKGWTLDISISDKPIQDISGSYTSQEGESIVIVKRDDTFNIEGEEWTAIGKMLGLNVVKSYFQNNEDGFHLLIARSESAKKKDDGSKKEENPGKEKAIYTLNGIYVKRDGTTGRVHWKMEPKEDAA